MFAEGTETAPIIVSALFGAEDHAWLDGLRRTHFPPERNQLAAHLTLFHHLPPSIGPELQQRLRVLTSDAPPPARATGLMSLGRGVAIRMESAGLRRVRDELADAFAGLLTPQDAGGWRPHVTIQNKVRPDEAKALLAILSAGFRERDVRIAGIGLFHYRGGPWEPMSRHMFRG